VELGISKENKDRKRRELARKTELQNLKAVELTAEHAKKEREEKKKQKELQITAEKNSRKRSVARIHEQPKALSMKDEKGRDNGEEKTGTSATNPTQGVTKKKAKKTQQRQGNRRLPVPCDSYGCKHVGVLELKELPRSYLKSYVKEGGCLFQMPCYDCKKKMDKKIIGNEGTARVLDLADLLTSKKGNVDEMARYCNYGVASHGMKEDDDWKERFACDMVLCIPCYKERMDDSDHRGSGREQRSHRRRK
jgi:hypothetical protein